MKRTQLLNNILEDTMAGFWDWNIPENTEYLSPTFKKMFGYEDHELENIPETRRSLIFEEDLDVVLKNLDDHIKSKGSVPYENLVRYKHKNGSMVHVICKGSVIEWAEDGSPKRMVGSHVDISKTLQVEKDLINANKRFNLIVEGINAGIWDWDVVTGKEWWSNKFFELLGYTPDEIPATFDTFLNLLLHPDDKAKVDNAVKQHFKDKIPYKLDIRLQTKSGKYLWFETSGNAQFNEQGEPTRMAGSIVNIDMKMKSQLQLQEAGNMAKMGSWEIDLITNKVFWSKEVYDIHEVPYNVEPTLEDGLNYYHKDYLPLITEKVTNTIENKEPFDVELILITAKKRPIWVRTMGKPIVGAKGKVVGVRGVFQDINSQKSKEENLKQSLDVITEQNNRLRNFAHIVSHNLRTHTGNFEMMLNMLKNADNELEKGEMMEHLDKISKNLTETILHLNQVVTINTDSSLQKVELDIEQYFAKTTSLIEADISTSKAEITADFSSWNKIRFVPAYLESILLNFTTNAIKYRHPERTPKINVSTTIENDKKVLLFVDNGLGIDLNKHREKLFGMYKTFHKNKNSKGIGLFITKNQVETLGGSITVESEVGKGSTFKVIF